MCYATLELRREILGSDHPTVGYTLTRVAGLRENQGRFEESLAHYQEAYDLALSLYGDIHPEIAYPLDGIAESYRLMGDPERALSFAQRALDVRREVLEPGNPEIVGSLNTLGLVYGDLGRLDRSIAAYREGFQIREAAFGPHSSQLVLPLNNLAFQYLRVGDLAEAEALLRRAQDIVDRELDELDMMRLVVTTNHARVLTARERFEDANRLARVALDGLEASVGKEHWRWAVARSIQGRALSRLGAFAPAEEALSESWAILQVSQPPGATYRIDAARYFVELFEQNGRASEAERWRETLATEERSGA